MWFDALQDLWWKLRWSARATSCLHVLAMWSPFNAWRIFFHRRRGVTIGRGVHIVQGSFLEESRPWLITVGDDVKISARVTIVTHDQVYNAMDPTVPYRYGEVVLGKGCILGPCSVVLPGVTVGEGALVGAGAVVTKDVPPGTVVAGPAASHLMSLEAGLEKARLRRDEYRLIDRETKYPWRFKRATRQEGDSGS